MEGPQYPSYKKMFPLKNEAGIFWVTFIRIGQYRRKMFLLQNVSFKKKYVCQPTQTTTF